MSYHGKLQVLKNGTADAEIQLWAYQQLEKELALTDKEIDELSRQMGMHLNDYEIDPLGNCLEFAKAILRKAQGDV